MEAVGSVLPQLDRGRAVKHRWLRLSGRSVAQGDDRVSAVASVDVHRRARLAGLRGLLRRRPLELEACVSAVRDPLAVAAGEVAIRLCSESVEI